MRNEYLQPLWEAFETYADYPAIVDEDGGRTTTYRDLGLNVRRVIAWARRRHIAPASFIPIVLPASMEYLACEIGLWMAQMTAVPLGPSFPEERIAYIRDHCEAPLLVTRETLDEIWACEPADLGGAEPDYPVEEQPALLLYTSGSTGSPKGIIHSFKGLSIKHTSKVGLTYSPEERWGMGAPPYFVASLTCFKVLKEGGQLHLFSPDTYRDLRRLEDYIAEHGITFTFLSPSMLQSFHNRADTLKVVFTGSERLSGQCGRDGYRLLNCYGMSETAGTVCGIEVRHPYDTTPVGRPEEAWCLIGDDGRPVEVGEEGELCLSGVYCDGYYKDPERTAELYRDGWLHTGDILRELPDGNLVYVNRRDWMAKINGQRVEPGEVENAIRRVSGVGQAVVKAFEGDTGSQYLAAFYTGEAEGEDIRAELARTLPPYMVPSFFVHVERFALLPNGKVNRKVLAAPDASALKSDYVAPASEAEARLCDAYCQIFGLERVGVDDDFFLLGGDSIRVMRLQQLLEDLPLTSKLISRERTPRRIARALEDALTAGFAPHVGPAALSRTQLGIYTESMARAGEAVYNNPVLLRLDPAVDAERLARAVERAVEAHAFVKLHIEEGPDGVPLMVPGNEPYSQTVESMDASGLAALLPTLVEPFDLHSGPLFRIRVIRTPACPYLFFDFHHIVFDGTSMRIFMADVDRAYAGEDVEPERFTGFDVAVEEARLRETDALEKARAYYEQTFGGLDLDSTPIPDRAEPGVAYATAEWTLDVDGALLTRFCAQVGVTANVLALAAFGRLLGAYAHEDQALFSTIYNGRDDVRCSRTMSMMVKTLPVHCSWDGQTSVADYVRAVKAQLLASMANDLFSFAEVASIADVSSDVLFAYQGDYLALGSVCGLPYTRVPVAFNATGGALDLQLFRDGDRLVLRAEYQRNRYSDEFVADMAASYGAILSGLVGHERVSDVEVASASQLSALDAFNDTEVAYDASQTVVSLFRSAAAAHPENLAVAYGDEELTYAELDRLTDRIARRIREAGLGRGDVVAILIGRCLQMPAMALGALKAGCAYQPLDPTYPDERLTFMVADSKARLLITTADLRAHVRDFEGTTLLVDDLTGTDALEDEAVGPLPEPPEPDDLFVLLYTSGTTGVPKGVRLLHRNLVCFIGWYQRYYGLLPEHRVSAYASFGFDANMMETYPALTCGAAVVIVPEEIRLDLVALNDYLEGHGVTHAFMTTQVGRQFAIDAGYPTLRHLSMGGEALVPFEVPEHPAIHNLYGPSECTVLVTAYRLKTGDGGFPIGPVIDNMKGYVVDTCGHRVPIGAVGELWIAGPQVGDGYLNRPEKTAEAFCRDPFDASAHASLYRTGDIVRYRRDGAIEFIGRRDGQVKIRGFRIELSEVEAVVREYPGVRDATVAAFDHPGGGKFVAAYVVADEHIDQAALGDFIRSRKPPYMVPAALVQLERIPLNQNGKVNRRALPVPELGSDEGLEDEAPRALNALEEELLRIAQEVIGATGFGVTVPLVRCGLTSIATIRLLTLVYKRFGVSIHARDLPDDASVVTLENAVLAAWMERGAGAPAEGGAGEAKAKEFRAPLTFAQTGVYYECLKAPTSLAYNMPACLAFDGSVTAGRLAEAVSAIVEAHPTLTARFVEEGGDVFLVPSATGAAIERTELAAGDVDAFKASFVRPFDLAAGPLSRFCVAEAEGRTLLFADFHHLAFDGASMAVFMRQLASALRGEAIERESYTYADHAAEERRHMESEGLEETRRHFDALFADFDHASELPSDRPASKVAGRRRTQVAPLDFDAIERSCHEAGVTPAALMLAACAYTLSRYANERHVFMATISNGRSDVRTADTMGMFVNTLPLSVELADESVDAFVARCAGVLADAVAHERYPFARIAADYGFAPRVMFEYQLGVMEGVDLGGLVGVESLEADAAKFSCTIRIEVVDGTPSVALSYDDALYSDELARDAAASIAIVAHHMASSSSDARLLGVSLVDEARAAELGRFHEQSSGPIPYATYHEGLEVQARLRPDGLALVACDGTFTFAELNAWSNRLAHALIERGVVPGSRIVLLLGRTSRVIMAIFGVMKAGCAYVPCDPTYPEERVRHIIEDSGAPLIITEGERVATYPNAVDVEDLLACTRTDDPGLAVSPDDLAYLIYTSGSTGKPKGVMLTHRGVCNFHADTPANILVHALVERAHALLAVTTLSFDMSVKEVGTPIVNGLTVVLADEEQVMDPGRLAELFERTGADAFNATHSRLYQYLQLPAFAQAISRCTVVLSGGEKYTGGLLPLLRKTTDALIINTYGPTETCVSSNMADLTHAERISVGRPLYNVWECIVDADGNELPAGVVGELLIGGPGVARGYNDLPERTAEAFIEREGRRMYRSGDYARWTHEGDVVILGRTDNQIKLRGLRIELGEVEAALARVAGVTHAIVKIDRIGGVEHLCAYYVADRPLDARTVRDAMATTLAKYMVPTAYLQLERPPLTPNGKVDYRNLPPAELLAAGEGVAAANEVEQFFCDAFKRILGLPEVGATDSFFEIGGTSLLAIRIIVEAQGGGYEVTYSDVFANPTPRDLARLVGGKAPAAEAERDAEIEDFDYTAIDDLLASNNLHGYLEGARHRLGNVLITGATGFLGVHILHEFIERHEGTAYCLLRGHGDVTAETRLKQQLFYYFENYYADLFGSRIVVVEGDVTRELPCTDDMRIDTVINCAAVVKHFSSGTEIEDVNVGGVRNLVGFCLERNAALVQISTGSTVKAPLRPGAVHVGKVDERQLYIEQELTNKYVRSKFLAERIVLDAVARQGLVAKVMRVGNLAPRTTDGEFQANYGTNASMGRLKSFALLGCAPYDQLDATMEFSPINQTAEAVLLLAQTPASCVLFHPFNHHAIYYGDVFEAMRRSGLAVRTVERDQFVSVLHAAEEDPEIASVLTSMLAYARRSDARPAVVPQAGNPFTMQVLYRMGFRWDPTSTDYVERFLETLKGFDFFELDAE